MSNHEYRDTEEASDARFNVPYTADGADPGDAHEDAVNELAERRESEAIRDVWDLKRHPVGDYFGAPAEHFKPMPSRVPGQALLRPEFTGHDARPVSHGLQWHSGDGTVRHNLADFPWEGNRLHGIETSNVELRTIYAHLIEAATIARREMRERGMQVDL